MNSLPESATVGGLRHYLSDQGIQDVGLMSDEEVVSFATTLLGDADIMTADVPSTHTFHDDIPTASTLEQSEFLSGGQNVSTNFESKQDIVMGDMDAKNNVDEIDTDKQAMVADFCGITGAPVDTSRYFLEAMGWNLQDAVSFYIEQNMNDNSGTTSTGTNPSRPSSTSYTQGQQHYQPPAMINPFFPDMSMFETAIGGRSIGGGSFTGLHASSSHHHEYYDDEDDLPDSPYNQTIPAPVIYDEDGLRAPDPVRQQVLIGGGRSRIAQPDMRGALARAEDPSVHWLFPPPNHLSFPGSLQDARTLCKEDKKWLIVNIQQHTVFASQILNRDTWVNDGVVTILRSNFLFWQRGHTSRDGQDYIERYHVSEEELPRIAILDPRTGAEILVILGYIPPEEFAMTVLEFLTDNSVEGLDAPAVRQRVVDRRRLGAQNSSAVQSSVAATYEGGEEDASMTEAFEHQTEVLKSVPPPPPPVKKWDVPDEPEVNEEGACKISIKLANGKNLVRRFRKSDLISALFGVAASHVPEAGVEGKPFDICTTFPTKSLSSFEDETLESHKLIGSALVMRWI